MASAEHTPADSPRNPTVEQAVLARVLFGGEPQWMQKARTALPHPCIFAVPANRIIWLACLEIDDERGRVDHQAVADRLSRIPVADVDGAIAAIERRLRERLVAWQSVKRLRPNEAVVGSAYDAIGGPDLFIRIEDANPQTARFDDNCALLVDYFRRRQLLLVMEATAQSVRGTDATPTILDRLGGALADLSRDVGGVDLHGIVDVGQELEHDADQETDRAGTITTGMPGLDGIYETMRPGGLYVLAARPGAGKTSFALSIADHLIRHHVEAHGVFFSLEVDRKDLLRKMIGLRTRKPFREIERATATTIRNLVTEFGIESRFDICDRPEITINTLRALLTRLRFERAQIGYVMIDYLQLISPSRDGMSEYERISEVSRALKILGREMRCPVIALSQMSRDSEKGVQSKSREPRLSDLRGSGSIEQDADAVIFLHHASSTTGIDDREIRQIKVIAAKNRFGPVGHCWMDFDPRMMLFSPGREPAGDEDASPLSARIGSIQHERGPRLRAAPSASEDLFAEGAEPPRPS